MVMGEVTFRQSRKGYHRTRVEGLHLFVHKQGPPVIEQQKPKAPSPIAYDKVSVIHLLFMLTHT
jgi:hypothetical protein